MAEETQTITEVQVTEVAEPIKEIKKMMKSELGKLLTMNIIKMANMFAIGHHVEVKGFDKWLGTTILATVADHYEDDFYIVKLWNVEDPDYSGVYGGGPRSDEYYFEKQEQYQILHRHLVCEAVPDQPSLQYNIGDVVDWNDRCTMRKGVVVRKRLCIDRRLTDPDEQRMYTILVDDTDVLEGDYSYRMRPHVPWA